MSTGGPRFYAWWSAISALVISVPAGLVVNAFDLRFGWVSVVLLVAVGLGLAAAIAWASPLHGGRGEPEVAASPAKSRLHRWVMMICLVVAVGAVCALVEPTWGKRTASVAYTVDATDADPDPVPGVTLKEGQALRIEQIGGGWNCGLGPRTGTAGTTADVDAPYYLAADGHLCSLVMKVGNSRWEEIGKRQSVVAHGTGELRLAANDSLPDGCGGMDCYQDNQGTARLRITIS